MMANEDRNEVMTGRTVADMVRSVGWFVVVFIVRQKKSVARYFISLRSCN